jgi:mono/diheme cytochrome c family protein
MVRFDMTPPVGLLTCLVLAAPPAPAADAPALWSGGAQAVLDRHCIKCHGPLEQKAGLRLDTAAGALKGGDDGPVVTAGKPGDSKLLQVLAPDADPHMPPKKQLADEEIAKLKAWVASVGRPAAAKPESDSRAAKSEVPGGPTAAIDHFLAAGWQARRLTPAPLCDDRTFVRRVTLDLAGRIPTPEEVSAFLFDASPNKRAALVDRLLAGDEAARNFREIWDVLLLGRGGRREDRRRDGGWFAFLETAFKQARPWDDVVRAIITARPERPEDKGAVWFLLERRNEHQQMAEAVAPVIYGTRIDCAQCHDHPLAGEIKQAHYWGLVAAFNRTRIAQRGASAVEESAAGGFLNFTNLKKESQPAVMTLLTGRTIDEPRPADGKDDDSPDRYVDPAAAVKVPKFSRRAALAEAATRDNPLLARSFVNHTWALLMGRGIVDPPDEMNSKHPPSHPELLDRLAADFTAHRYDVRRLIRSIVLSRGYQLAPWAGPNAPPPEAFAAAAEKPLTAEAVARSLRVAAGRPADDDALRRAVTDRFPDVLPRTPRATIQQAMFLANSDLVAALFKPEPASAAARLAPLPTPADRVRDAFRRALVRDPDAEELARGVVFLKAHAGDPAGAAGQLLWALVAGPEFLTNH